MCIYSFFETSQYVMNDEKECTLRVVLWANVCCKVWNDSFTLVKNLKQPEHDVCFDGKLAVALKCNFLMLF